MMPKSSEETAVSRRTVLSAALPAWSVIALATCLALSLDAPARAQPLRPCPASPTDPNPAPNNICAMTIKIFNNDNAHWIYPVLTTGQGATDIWMQAWFSVTIDQLPNNPYPKRKSYRLYLNPTGTGIPPNTGISLTLPLFTQLKNPIISNPGPTDADTFVDWWNGGTILIYSNSMASPPQALTDALNNVTNPKQQEVVVDRNMVKNTVLPTCVGVQSKPTQSVPTPPPAPTCQALTIYSDTADLPKNDPSQLLEYTLGAMNKPPPPSMIAFALDTRNVDFDVSYVNLAFLPAAMGPYQNDQVGYVGSPKTIDAFEAALTKFQTDFAGWPQFVTRTGVTLLKFPSPLEVFARLGGAQPPPDLTPVPIPANWPNSLWKPIADLRMNWTFSAGKVTSNANPPYYTFAPGTCGAPPPPNAPPPTTFCGAIAAVTGLLLANYTNYRTIFNKQCSGTPAVISDNLLISHVYGWAPWTESTDGIPGHGCGAAVNLLENTPGYSQGTDFTSYLNVKQAFDGINYGTLPAEIYPFNPWVTLIHDPNNLGFIGAPNAYAYSVDDAVGNIQAEGQGFIVDIADTVNLENPNLAGPPITINLGFGGSGFDAMFQFTNYAVCQTTPDRIKPINPAFPSFVVSGTSPTCPQDPKINPNGLPIVYLWDSKTVSGGTPAGQEYTFMIAVPPDQFPFFTDPAAAKWTPAPPNNTSTAFPIACTGNAPPNNPNMVIGQFEKSSWQWCCDKASSAGVFAYSAPEPHNPHHIKNFFVITQKAAACTDFKPDPKNMCPPELQHNVLNCSQGQ
jgi:hypothetical protein